MIDGRVKRILHDASSTTQLACYRGNFFVYKFFLISICASFLYQVTRIPLMNNGRTCKNYHSLKISVRSNRYSLSNAMLKTRNFTKNVWAH